MTNKSTKRALISSVLALVLCFTMLLGTTFAWFTDSATSKGNLIQTGNLDVELYQYDDAGTLAKITNTSAPSFFTASRTASTYLFPVTTEASSTLQT